MSESNLIPISNEQAKAFQEAVKLLRGLGGFLEKTLGTVPEDLVGLLGGDWLRVRRAENAARIAQKAKDRLEARGAKQETASLSITLPILVAAADESREEMQDLWARLLAAAADPSRARSFRIAYIDTIKKMDPLDAAVLRIGHREGGKLDGAKQQLIRSELGASSDEVGVSIEHLGTLGLLTADLIGSFRVTPFGREFLRAIAD